MKELGSKGVHEKISRSIVLTRLKDHMKSEEEANFVADLIDTPAGRRSVAGDIVSGPTDADKFDYLLRDSHYCGVEYGKFDLERVLETATVVSSAGQTQLGFQEGGLYAVEGLLLARRSMHRQVYRHPTRRATDLMLIRAITLAVEAGDDLLSRLVPTKIGSDGSEIDEAFLAKYLEFDDETVRRHLENDVTGPANELGVALRRRQLVHQVAQVDAQLIEQLRSSLWLSKLLDPQLVTRAVVSRVEEAISADLSCDRHWVFVTLESETNPLYRPPSWDQSPGDIVITRRDRTDEKFATLSDIWSESTARPRYTYLSLFTARHEANVPAFQNWDANKWTQYVLEKFDALLQ